MSGSVLRWRVKEGKEDELELVSLAVRYLLVPSRSASYARAIRSRHLRWFHSRRCSTVLVAPVHSGNGRYPLMIPPPV